jgi:hypothetical protein
VSPTCRHRLNRRCKTHAAKPTAISEGFLTRTHASLNGSKMIGFA